MERFLFRHEQLVRENERLMMMNQSLTYRNKQLISDLSRASLSTQEDMTLSVESSSQTPHKSIIDEEQFRAGLQPRERPTSSPVHKKATEKSSGHTSRDSGHDSQGSHTGKDLSERLIGEIAFQLDRRILSFVFQNHKRFYGYSVSNIARKIIDASTHPLTGQVDEDYRLLLSQRYEDIKDTLSGRGYDIRLHPQFSEFIVNMYGILHTSPKPGSWQATDFYNPLYLKSAIETMTPSKLHKDLTLLLDCLVTLALQDGKPILSWS